MGLLFNQQTESITAASNTLSLGNNSGSIILPKGDTAARPGSAVSAMLRYNTVSNLIEYYNGTAWVTPGNSFTTEQTVASATTTDLGSASSNIILISGSTTITSFGSSANTASPIYFVRFTGSLTLTNSSSLILPNNSNNIITNIGDTLIAEYLGSGNWKVLFYQYISGPIVNYYIGGTTTGSASAQVLSSVIPNNFTLTQGLIVSFIAGYSSTGSTTLNVVGSGVITMKKRIISGLSNIASGDLVAGVEFTVIYDGTYWQLLDPIPVSFSFGNIAPLNIGANLVNDGSGNLALATNPALGSATATTQSPGTSNTTLATTAFVNGTALTLASGTTAITQSSTDNTTKVATTAYTQSAILGGIGQSWSDVSGSRSKGVIYYNYTGRPIMVNISCTYTSSTGNAQLIINGITVAAATGNTPYDTGNLLSGIVPVSGSYELTGSNITFAWVELR